MISAMNRLLFTRFLACVYAANFATLVVMNATGMFVAATSLVWLAALAVVGRFCLKLQPRRFQLSFDGLSLTFLGLLLIMLVASKATYLLDWLPGQAVLSHSDDYARILEILAMTGNDRYPLLFPGNTDYVFSFYYASLYPFAVMAQLGFFLTLKEVVALGNIFYYILILGSLYEIVWLLLRDRARVRLALFMLTIFGGLDWLFFLGQGVDHYEMWALRFDGHLQYSSIFTSLTWVIHHFNGAYGCLVAYVCFIAARHPGGNRQRYTFVLILFASAFYASPFAVLVVPLLFAWHYRLTWRLIAHGPGLAVCVSWLIPLYVFLGRTSQEWTWAVCKLAIPFSDSFWINKAVSFPLFVLLVPVIEWLGIPLLLLLFWRRWGKGRSMIVCAWVFFLSTYLVQYSMANNWCMRGMVIPIFIFIFQFARLVPKTTLTAPFRAGMGARVAVGLLLAVLCLGTLGEARGRIFNSLQRSGFYYQWQGKEVPKLLASDIHGMAISEEKVLPWEKVKGINPFFRYDPEKFINKVPLENMEYFERELIRDPVGNYWLMHWLFPAEEPQN